MNNDKERIANILISNNLVKIRVNDNQIQASMTQDGILALNLLTRLMKK